MLDDAATRAGRDRARAAQLPASASLPVYIEFPRDMTAAPTTAVPVLPRRPADPEALAECADEIIARLATREVAR